MIKNQKNITKTVIINGLNCIIKIQDPKEFDIKAESDDNGNFESFIIYIKNTSYKIFFTKDRKLFNSLLCDIYEFFNNSKHHTMFVYKEERGGKYNLEYK